MPRIIEIDVSALKDDYEEGMPWPELLKKYDASRSALVKRLRAAGARIRGRGGRTPSNGAGAAMPRLKEKSARRGLGVLRGGSFLSADAAADFTSLLDKQWQGFTLQEKVCAVNEIYGQRAPK